MRVARIHIDAHLGAGEEITLDDPASHHVGGVLRLRAGHSIVLFNGRGGEYSGVITHAARNATRVRVLEFHDRETESPLDIVLVQGISRGDRMDYAVQKAVELGVRGIVPVITERSVVQLKGERAERRQIHWQRVAIGACAQCGRNRIPDVGPPLQFERWLQAWAGGAGLLLSPRADRTLGGMTAPAGAVTLLIGPEGGLSEREEQLALAAGFSGVRLGPRILRTETAAVAMLAALQTCWGDFAGGCEKS